jgi:hypothetical protein
MDTDTTQGFIRQYDNIRSSGIAPLGLTLNLNRSNEGQLMISWMGTLVVGQGIPAVLQCMATGVILTFHVSFALLLMLIPAGNRAPSPTLAQPRQPGMHAEVSGLWQDKVTVDGLQSGSVMRSKRAMLNCCRP